MDVTTYDTGFFAGRSEMVTRSAGAVVPVICELLNPTSVVDFGCGQGEWLETFGLEDTVGVDVAAPAGFYRYDLQYALDLERTFDLALCLEVGEHLPASAADVLVDTITRHSATVVFSAAVPGQAGKGHINCQPHEYWHQKFRARGYEVRDLIRPRVRDDRRVSPWYRDNTFVYVKEEA